MSAYRAVPLVLGVVCSLFMPASALAHRAARTAKAHLVQDAVAHSAAAERRLQRLTASATRSDAAQAAAAVAGDEHLVGQWGPVVDWPVVAIHVALLPNGKVLAYDSVGDKAAESYPVHDPYARDCVGPRHRHAHARQRQHRVQRLL